MSAPKIMTMEFVIGEQRYKVEIPEILLTEAEDFFNKIDQDMDRGWQMSRQWVDNPNTIQRCQILADKIITALGKGNQQMVELSTAYILKRLPGVTYADIDIDGDINQTHFEIDKQPIAPVI